MDTDIRIPGGNRSLSLEEWLRDGDLNRDEEIEIGSLGKPPSMPTMPMHTSTSPSSLETRTFKTLNTQQPVNQSFVNHTNYFPSPQTGISSYPPLPKTTTTTTSTTRARATAINNTSINNTTTTTTTTTTSGLSQSQQKTPKPTASKKRSKRKASNRSPVIAKSQDTLTSSKRAKNQATQDTPITIEIDNRPTSPITIIEDVSTQGMQKYIYDQNRMYIGFVKEEKKHGFGTFFIDGNKFYEGYWENDLRHGEGTAFDEKKEIIAEGNWEQGLCKGTIKNQEYYYYTVIFFQKHLEKIYKPSSL
jgi:hypothetical protein